MRHIIESCDGPGCSRTREFVLTGTNGSPQTGWFTLHILPRGDDDAPPAHIGKSACSTECATKIVAVVLASTTDDLTIEFCPGHKGH